MDGSEYQLIAQQTMSQAMIDQTGEGILNIILGIQAELGELYGVVKKDIEGKNKFNREKFVDECGDVHWYLSAFCTAFGVQLNEVLQFNLKKLAGRHPEKMKLNAENRLSIKLPVEYFDQMQAEISNCKSTMKQVAAHCSKIGGYPVESNDDIVDALETFIDLQAEYERSERILKLIEECAAAHVAIGPDLYGNELVTAVRNAFDRESTVAMAIVDPSAQEKIENLRHENQNLRREMMSLRMQVDKLRSGFIVEDDRYVKGNSNE